MYKESVIYKVKYTVGFSKIFQIIKKCDCATENILITQLLVSSLNSSCSWILVIGCLGDSEVNYERFNGFLRYVPVSVFKT